MHDLYLLYGYMQFNTWAVMKLLKMPWSVHHYLHLVVSLAYRYTVAFSSKQSSAYLQFFSSKSFVCILEA